MLLHLPWLLCPNHGFGPDRDLRVLEPYVLAKVPTGMIDAEPLCRFGLSCQRHYFGWALQRWWICGLVGRAVLQRCL
jgi:hypothetical protein